MRRAAWRAVGGVTAPEPDLSLRGHHSIGAPMPTQKTKTDPPASGGADRRPAERLATGGRSTGRAKGDTARIGPLVFRNSRLVRWGSKSRGAPLEPVERLWAEKGSREKPPECDLRWLVHTDAPRKERWLPRGASHSTGWCAS